MRSYYWVPVCSIIVHFRAEINVYDVRFSTWLVGSTYYAVYARWEDLEGHDGEGFGAGGFNSGLPHNEPGEFACLILRVFTAVFHRRDNIQ